MSLMGSKRKFNQSVLLFIPYLILKILGLRLNYANELYLLLFVGAFICYILLNSKFVISKEYLFLLIFLLAQFLFSSFTSSIIVSIKHTANFLINLSPIIIYDVIEKIPDKEEQKNTCKLLVTIFIVEFLYCGIRSLIFLSSNPYAIRNMASYHVGTTEGALLPVAIGGGYPYVFSLILLVPLILFFAKEQKNLTKKILMFSLAFFFFFVIVKANVTTAVILCFFGCVFALIKKKSTKLITIGIFVTIMLVLSLSQEIFENIIYAIASLFGEDSIISDRLKSIISVLYDGEIDSAFGDRMVRFAKSIKAFIQYPIFGIGARVGFSYAILNEYIGVHTELIDLLAEFGLPAAACLFYFLRRSYKKVGDNIQSKKGKGVYTVMGFVYVCCGFFDPILSTNMLLILFIFTPCLIKLFD